MSDIRIVNEQTGELEASQEPTAIHNPSMEMGGFDSDSIALSQVLGIETDSERAKYKDDFGKIKEWAKDQGYKDPVELKMLVRDIINRLGTTPFGENLITRVSRYAYLQLQSKQIEKEQESLLR
jgi:hypothetical protein